jgi:gamma-glutamyltranspeptidase/glutathione hydrolase
MHWEWRRPGATHAFYKEQKMAFPPDTDRSPPSRRDAGGLMTMLAEFGTLSLAEVLAPAIKMADGYPMEQDNVERIEKNREHIVKWPDSKRIFLPREDETKRDGAADRKR